MELRQYITASIMRLRICNDIYLMEITFGQTESLLECEDRSIAYGPNAKDMGIIQDLTNGIEIAHKYITRFPVPPSSSNDQ